MINSIHSDLPSFKTLEFKSGLNILISKKEPGSGEQQTRNRAGKSSLIEIIHFLTGAKTPPESMFRTAKLREHNFGMSFNLNGQNATTHRSGKTPSKIYLPDNPFSDKKFISKPEWLNLLGEQWFQLDKIQGYEGKKPTTRSLLAYLVRREASHAFLRPDKQAKMQQDVDSQVALTYLLGLDWHVPSDWQKVRDRETMLKNLKKAAKQGAFGSVIGKASELRTQLTIKEGRLKRLKPQVESFKVHPQYSELEVEANQLTRASSRLSNENLIDREAIKTLEVALKSEAPPPMVNLASIYEEAGIVLPGVVLRRYEEVQAFHESVIRNRHDYLRGELLAAEQRIVEREQKIKEQGARLVEVMGILKAHGALEQFSKLQGEVGRLESEVKTLRQRFEAAETLEGTKSQLELERSQLSLRLQQNFTEQDDLLSDAILNFQEISDDLYEQAGSMNVETTSNGPAFSFNMQGDRSKGIQNMQIFCFDMMLMKVCSERGIGTGFLVHDSHLFDGVDGRQVMSALKVGAKTAKELGFQYIVTMNEDDAFKETIQGFDVNDYILPTVLTDATEDGGLFGMRFG